MARDKLTLALLATALTLCASSCDSKPAPAPSPTPAAPSTPSPNPSDIPPPAQLPPDTYGTAVISGKVTLAEAPKPASGFTMTGDVFCAQATQGKPILPEGRRVGKDLALPYVFVYVKSGINGTFTPPTQPMVLNQKDCHYDPHVFGLMTNQPLEIRNGDQTAHNIHALSQKNDSFNLAQAQQGLKATKVFACPEIMVKFKCDVHSWMEAYAGVLPHPFFAVTDAEGRYSIPRLPAGEYVIEVWHEIYGMRRQNVTLTAGQQADLNFSFARQP
jgi:hypothetical protein